MILCIKEKIFAFDDVINLNSEQFSRFDCRLRNDHLNDGLYTLLLKKLLTFDQLVNMENRDYFKISYKAYAWRGRILWWGTNQQNSPFYGLPEDVLRTIIGYFPNYLEGLDPELANKIRAKIANDVFEEMNVLSWRQRYPQSDPNAVVASEPKPEAESSPPSTSLQNPNGLFVPTCPNVDKRVLGDKVTEIPHLTT